MYDLPLVGITTDRTVAGPHPSHSAGEKYIDAVIGGANALAMLLPSLGDRQSVDAVLRRVDGLLFTGSYSNVEPRHYGGAASQQGTLHDPARDATALPLIRAAIAANVPVLAVCRGFQEMNVAFGGTLHQRVHEVEGLMDHREDKTQSLAEQYAPSHALRMTPGGQLRALALAEGLDPLDVQVNSLHGQGIDRLGYDLLVEGVAPDGLVEAIRYNSPDTFAIAVQWHPEWRYWENPLSKALFEAFGQACRKRRRQLLAATL